MGTGAGGWGTFPTWREAKAEALRNAIAIALGHQESKVAALRYQDAASRIWLNEKIGPLG